jgi:hypothetical protein
MPKLDTPPLFPVNPLPPPASSTQCHKAESVLILWAAAWSMSAGDWQCESKSWFKTGTLLASTGNCSVKWDYHFSPFWGRGFESLSQHFRVKIEGWSPHVSNCSVKPVSTCTAKLGGSIKYVHSCLFFWLISSTASSHFVLQRWYSW